MPLTRKHFKAIASIVSLIENDHDRNLTTARFSIYLRGENPNFSDSRFVLACDPPIKETSPEPSDWLAKD